VNKTKVPTKVVCCDWSPDGQLLALGLYGGKVLLRDKTGAELFTIEKSEHPCWCLAFCP
jgi:intraflagellar transport protein 122